MGQRQMKTHLGLNIMIELKLENDQVSPKGVKSDIERIIWPTHKTLIPATYVHSGLIKYSQST